LVSHVRLNTNLPHQTLPVLINLLLPTAATLHTPFRP